MTINADALDAVVRRHSHTVEVVGDGLDGWLIDLENGVVYRPVSVRDALGWIAAGEADNDGSNPRTSRLTRWWHKKCGLS